MRHGTYAGWTHHHKMGTPVCADCRAAQAAYMREYRSRQHWPLELPALLDDVDGGLGLAIAYALRESA